MELDQFMKTLLVEFLDDVMKLFFPDLAQRLDFAQKKDLNKELYAHPPQGAERALDVLIEVPVVDPPPEAIIVHFESQQRKRFDFPARMLGYHCLLYIREIEAQRRDAFTWSEFTVWQNRKRIFPVVFCHYSLESGVMAQQTQVGLPNARLIGEYTEISFPRLSAREYLEKDNVVVCALAVFMDAEGLSPPHLKAACYRKLAPYLPTLTRTQLEVIIYAVETYVSLTADEQLVYQSLIQNVYPEVSQMIINPLIERGRLQGVQEGRQLGVQEGRQEGRQEGMQASILKILSHRFPAFPTEIRNRILALTDTTKLEHLLEATLEVDSPEELTKNGFFE